LVDVAFEARVAEDCVVGVHVYVYPAGGDDEAGGVDDSFALQASPNLGDHAAFDADVGPAPRAARAVDDPTVPHHKIKHDRDGLLIRGSVFEAKGCPIVLLAVALSSPQWLKR
jgi:hypothetical protein